MGSAKMKNGENKDYSFGNKKNWRRWKWNRIVERIDVKPSEAIVLYLAGKEDHDRSIALQKGFRDENLIAVDRSSAVVDELRRKGVNSIRSEFLDCLRALPSGRNVNVVDADFCCDAIDSIAIEMNQVLKYSPELRGAVVCVNFCRGRGASLGRINAVRSHGGEKHRGKLFILQFVRAALCLESREDELELDALFDLYELVLTNMQSAFAEYHSKESKQYFDSSVFISPRRGAETDQRIDLLLRAQLDRNPSIVRRVSAALAHRTMRKDRIGPYAEAHS